MPNYKYRCLIEYCQNEFNVHQSIHSSPLRSCDLCGEESLERVIHAANAFVRGEAKTIGLLAERNTQALSSAQRNEREAIAEHQKREAKLELRKELINSGMKDVPDVPDKIKPVDKRLAKLTDRQKERYLDSGKLP